MFLFYFYFIVSSKRNNKMFDRKKITAADFEKSYELMRNLKASEQNTKTPSDEVRLSAEARFLIHWIVNQKRLKKQLPEIGWDAMKSTLNHYFLPASQHPICNRLRGDNMPAVCDIRNLNYKERFPDPKTGYWYIATGTLYVCVARGAVHQCNSRQCTLAQSNPDEQGTKTCPVSGQFLGGVITDRGPYHTSGHDASAMDDRIESVSKADDIRDGVEYEDDDDASAMIRSPGGAATPIKKRAYRGGRPPNKKQLVVHGEINGTEEHRLYQKQHKQQLDLDHSPTHRASVELLVDKIFVLKMIRSAMKNVLINIRTNILRDAALMMARCQQKNQSVDIMNCISIVANNMMSGLTSILHVCDSSVPDQISDDDKHYIQQCLFALFHNLRSVSSKAEAGSVEAAINRGFDQKDNNLKNIPFILLDILACGIRATRTIDTTGRIRVILSSLSYEGDEAGVADGVQRVDTSPDAANASEDKNQEDQLENEQYGIVLQEHFLLVPPHPGLRKFAPDMSTLMKLRLPFLERETEQSMKKRRGVINLFTQMMHKSDPSIYCLSVLVSPLNTKIFLN